MRSSTAILALAAWTAFAAPAAAQMPAIRSFGGFENDAKVAPGVWAEPRFIFRRDDVGPADRERITTGSRMAYGGPNFEAGLMVPYIRDTYSPGKNYDGFGDVEVYGKLLPIDADGFGGAVGMTLITPTGDEDKGLGYGSVGFVPFASFAASMPGGPLELRGSVGYRFFADSRGTVARTTTAPILARAETITYRTGLFLSTSDRLGIRFEFAGESIDASGPSSPMWLEPGIDLKFPVKTVAVVLRPTGLVGLNPESFDWGVGVGLTVLWSGPAAKAPPKGQPF